MYNWIKKKKSKIIISQAKIYIYNITKTFIKKRTIDKKTLREF